MSHLGIYSSDVVGDPKNQSYYVLGAANPSATKSTILYQYDFADGAVTSAQPIVEHPGEDWWIAGAETELSGSTVKLRWVEISSNNGGMFKIIEGPPFVPIAGCTADCFDAGVADIHDFHSSSTGILSLATSNGSPVLLLYGDTSAQTVPVLYDEGHSAPVIYDAAVNENNMLFMALKYYSQGAGAEVYGHSYLDQSQPINDVAFNQTSIVSPPTDFNLKNEVLAFWIPAENAIYRMNDQSIKLEAIQGVDELTPSSLGNSGGIDLFTRKWKTCIAIADSENQRIIEWELDPSTMPGNPKESFLEMLEYLEKQNIEKTLSYFSPKLHPNYSMLFYKTYNQLPDISQGLREKPITTDYFEGTKAVYAMHFQKDDGTGNMVDVLSDIEFIKFADGRWIITQM